MIKYYFFSLKRSIYLLLERVTKNVTEGNLPTVSHSKWLSSPRLQQVESRSLEFHLGSTHGWQGPWVVFCYFPRCIFQDPNWKYRSWEAGVQVASRPISPTTVPSCSLPFPETHFVNVPIAIFNQIIHTHKGKIYRVVWEKIIEKKSEPAIQTPIGEARIPQNANSNPCVAFDFELLIMYLGNQMMAFHSCGRPRWSSGLQHVSWPCAICCSHLGNEPVDGRCICLQPLPTHSFSLSLSLCLSNK